MSKIFTRYKNKKYLMYRCGITSNNVEKNKIEILIY